MRTHIKFVSVILLLSLASAVFAETVPLTAADRVKNLANEEAAWRYGSGAIKLVLGGVVTGLGYSMASNRENIFATIILLPVGAAIMVPGLITFGWGAADLVFGSREYENRYDTLKLAGEAERENQALQYLKEKAEKDKKDRAPSFWNAFGLFSMFETPAEREYKGYLKDRGQQL